jgi:hypothetical protein
MAGLNAKQPKAVAAAASAINEALVYVSCYSILDIAQQHYRAFGVKVVPPGPIFKILPKIFGHSDKNVRAEVGICLSTKPKCIHKLSMRF